MPGRDVLGEAAHVGIKGLVAVGVLYLDHIAVGAVAAGESRPTPLPDGLDRRARGAPKSTPMCIFE